jgi:transcription-repair coupling factor (superfamily II helicase)
VAKEELRLEAYRRLAMVTTAREVDDIRAEWVDRYGPVPEPAQRLLAIGRLRAECHRTGVRDIAISRDQARIAPLHLRASEVMRLRRLARNAIYKEEAGQLVIPIKKGEDVAARLVALLSELIPDAALASAG